MLNLPDLVVITNLMTGEDCSLDRLAPLERPSGSLQAGTQFIKALLDPGFRRVDGAGGPIFSNSTALTRALSRGDTLASQSLTIKS